MIPLMWGNWSSQTLMSRKTEWWLPEPGGKWKMRSYCLMGKEFQFCKLKKFWRLVSQQCEYT